MAREELVLRPRNRDSTAHLWGGRNAGAKRKHFGWGPDLTIGFGPPPEKSCRCRSKISPPPHKGEVSAPLQQRAAPVGEPCPSDASVFAGFAVRLGKIRF